MFFDPMWARRGCVSQAAFFFDIAVVRCAVPGRTWRGVWKLLRLRETPIKAKSAIGLTPIARKLSQQPLRQHANCEADGDVARPMRQKNNSCQNQPGTETPDDISLFGRKSARGRSQRAQDMLIRAPCEGFRRPFRPRPGTPRDGIGDCDVNVVGSTLTNAI
jgi:hypothetical protein